MLSIRPNCECCNQDLAPDSQAVVICSFECTFCWSCAETKLGFVCPNCGGELLLRPVRPATGAYSLNTYPASTERVYHPEGCAAPA